MENKNKWRMRMNGNYGSRFSAENETKTNTVPLSVRKKRGFKSNLPCNRGGIKACGDALLPYFWCSLKEFFS